MWEKLACYRKGRATTLYLVPIWDWRTASECNASFKKHKHGCPSQVLLVNAMHLLNIMNTDVPPTYRFHRGENNLIPTHLHYTNYVVAYRFDLPSCNPGYICTCTMFLRGTEIWCYGR